MATATNTTAAFYSKDRAHAHTPVSRSFNHPVACLDAFIDREQRLDTPGVDVLSSTFAKDLTEAEAAREALCEAVGDTLIAPDYRPADGSLRRLAHVLYLMLTIEDDGDRQHLHQSTITHRDIFWIEGQTAAARLTRRLSNSFFSHFDEMTSLREFGGDGYFDCREQDFAPVPA